MVQEHPAELRAQVLAAVGAGETSYRVAKRLGLPESTVRTWVGKSKPVELIATADKKQEFQTLYEEALKTGLDAFLAIAKQVNDDTWRTKQDAHGLAVLGGVLFDKCGIIAGAFGTQESGAE